MSVTRWLVVARADAPLVESALASTLTALGRTVEHGPARQADAEVFTFTRAHDGLLPIVSPSLQCDLDLPCVLSGKVAAPVWLIDVNRLVAPHTRSWCFENGKVTRAHTPPPRADLPGRIARQPSRQLSAVWKPELAQRASVTAVPYGAPHPTREGELPLEQVVAESGVTPAQLRACLAVMAHAEGPGVAGEAAVVLAELTAGTVESWRPATLVHRVARFGVGLSTYGLRCFERALAEKNEPMLEAARALLHAAPDKAIQTRVSLKARAVTDPAEQHALMVLYDELCAERE